jgi:hypothetical protein
MPATFHYICLETLESGGTVPNRKPNALYASNQQSSDTG